MLYYKSEWYACCSLRLNILYKERCEVNEIKWLDFDEAVETITYENTRELFKEILKDIKGWKIN